MLEFFTMKPLYSDTFVDIYRRTKPPWIAQVAVAVLIAAAVVVTASPIKGGLPTLVLAVAFIAVGVVWWFFLRRHGQRGNDYDPLKTDAEAARTPFSWKEEGRFVFLLILSMAPLQFSSVMDSWKFAWSAGALTLVVALWTMFHDTWRPVRYVSPLAIAKAHPEMSLSEPAEWMWGYFYASKLCPRGRQIRSDALTNALAKWSWEPQAALAAVDELCQRGDMVKIRELRSTAENATPVYWLTLTEAGRDRFQARFPVGNNSGKKETSA